MSNRKLWMTDFFESTGKLEEYLNAVDAYPLPYYRVHSIVQDVAGRGFFVFIKWTEKPEKLEKAKR